MIVWKERALVFFITALFAVISLTYALLATKVYRAEILLAPVSEQSNRSGLGALGALASIGGVRIAGQSDVETNIAILKSRSFTYSFILENNLVSLLSNDNGDINIVAEENQPDVDAVVLWDTFKKFKKIRKVSLNKVTGMITLTVDWTDPQLAAIWANTLVNSINLHIKEKAVKDAHASILYLKEELEETSEVELRAALYRLFQDELQTIKLAKIRTDFAFRVIDPAVVPEDRFKPRRTIICVLGTLLGGIVALFVVLFRNWLKSLSLERRCAG